MASDRALHLRTVHIRDFLDLGEQFVAMRIKLQGVSGEGMAEAAVVRQPFIPLACDQGLHGPEVRLPLNRFAAEELLESEYVRIARAGLIREIADQLTFKRVEPLQSRTVVSSVEGEVIQALVPQLLKVAGQLGVHGARLAMFVNGILQSFLNKV